MGLSAIIQIQTTILRRVLLWPPNKIAGTPRIRVKGLKYPSVAVFFLPSCCASSSSWWSPSFSFFFVLLHARRGLLHSPRGGLWFFLVAVLLLPHCGSSFPSTSHAAMILLLSFFFLHFPCRYSSYSSSFLCRFTPLMLLLRSSWVLDVIVLDVVHIGLILLFENKNDIFLEKPHTDQHSDWWSIWVFFMFLLNNFFSIFFF